MIRLTIDLLADNREVMIAKIKEVCHLLESNTPGHVEDCLVEITETSYRQEAVRRLLTEIDAEIAVLEKEK